MHDPAKLKFRSQPESVNKVEIEFTEELIRTTDRFDLMTGDGKFSTQKLHEESKTKLPEESKSKKQKKIVDKKRVHSPDEREARRS